jgi:peptidyl-tRNA hydrolase
MPAVPDRSGADAPAAMNASQNDPWAMYYVVRKDRALSLGQAMSLAGAGAVLCAQQWRDTPAWAQAFAAWHEHSYRKVSLRADAIQFGRLRDELDCSLLDGPDGETLLCLPPRRKSAREALLACLQAYTDAPRPDQQPAPPTGVVMRYVVRAAVMKSMGKAMAQAGHAALMCADLLEPAHRHAFAAWRENARAGVVLLGDDLDWARVQAQTDCVVVRDAGLTQVQAGTETVLALVPSLQPNAAVAALERVA